jgi:NADH pyrophosphatase NudC (nudix superfamily)
MSKSIRGNHSHLTLSDRILIEQELDQGSTFYSIAKVLHKDPTTISKEVKRARSLYSADAYAKYCQLCWNYRDCREREVCTHGIYKCKRACRYCWSNSALRIVSSSLLMYATNQQKLLLYAIPVIISEPVHWKKLIIRPQ